MDKEVRWGNSTLDDLRLMPEGVREAMGGAIRAAQEGGISDLASPMKGPLRDVVEVCDEDISGTFRLMYTISLGDTVYVLDVFQKKSKSGIATPKRDLDRIERRLKAARQEHAEMLRTKGSK